MKRFAKKALPIAVAAVMIPGIAAAEGVAVSGFADIIYTAVDGSSTNTANGAGGTEGKFTADGEIDFVASPADGVTVRMDVDVTAGSTTLEQAYFAWGAMESVTVLGGIFNNPIGYEAEDAPDIDFTSHGAVYAALDGQTALAGDNIAGVAAAVDLGVATVTVAVLNELQQTDEENSFALVVNASPVKGLDLELGFVTQASNADSSKAAAAGASVGNVTNFNAVYTGVENVMVGVDYLTGAEVLDSAYDVWAGYQMDAFGAKVRVSQLAWANGVDDDSVSLYLSYQAAKNLSVALENRKDDNGTTDNTTTTLEFIATF